MRVGFAGCHEISWRCLKAVAELCRANGDELAGAFNLLPEKGVKYSGFVEFDSLASEHNFPLHKITNLADAPALDLLRSFKLDVFFIIGWHRIVPQEVIDAAPVCLGMHSSLLPKNRGSSPLNWALIRGEKQGGITLFFLTAGVDSGDVVAQKSFPLEENDSCREAYEKAAVAAVDLLRENWGALREGKLPRTPQDESQATFNERRRPEDGKIDWSKPAGELHNWVRALAHPYPGAFTFFRGKKLFVWKARLVQGSRIQEQHENLDNDERGAVDKEPGTLVSLGERDGGGAIAACQKGLLEILSLQFEGEQEFAARAFASAYGLQQGEKMG